MNHWKLTLHITRIALIAAMCATISCDRSSEDPKINALKFMRAVQNQDWRTVYRVSAMDKLTLRVYPNEEAFANGISRAIATDPNPDNQRGYQAYKKLTDLQVGEPRMFVLRAYVPTTSQVDAFVNFPNLPHPAYLNGLKGTFHGQIEMMKVDGTWKCNMTRGNVAEVFDGAFGKPDLAGLQKEIDRRKALAGVGQ